MAVTDDFTPSELDLNGEVQIGFGDNAPTALVWGPDGRLYVTAVGGDVFILDVAFGDKNPDDGDPSAQFYVTGAETVGLVKSIQNYDDDGSTNNTDKRQVTGIDVVQQYDANGDPVTLDNGAPAVVMYVTSSDSRIGGDSSGADKGLDTNSGVITRLTQQSDGSWDAVDIVRGLARSEENHATNGLEIIQEFDGDGKLVSERMIVASGGNANTGAPSNNFAGQQEQPTSAAILEVDLNQIRDIEAADGLKTDNGRAYVYDLPTLDDPTRTGSSDNNDPFGGNDGLNSAYLPADGPVQIYSAGYRNAYDFEVTEDGRVWTYDNGANNNWGGRPAGEDADGDADATENGENTTPEGYISTNYAVEDNNEIAGNFNPANWDNLHEVTRSDDLDGRQLSFGQGGLQTYTWEHPDLGTLELVYGGHPNPTRAEGSRAGLLYSPNNGTQGALLMVSNVDHGDGSSDFLEVVDWLSSLSYTDETINQTVVAVNPGVRYSDTFAAEYANGVARPDAAGEWSLVEDASGPVGLPANIADIVPATNPIEGDYQEGGYTDSAVDTNKGSVNGLAEYTSTILDDEAAGIKMSGALWATVFSGSYIIIGRDENGVIQTTTTNQGTGGNGPRTVAADRETLPAGGGPLGIATIGDDLTPHGGEQAFQGSVWVATYKENGPVIEIFQPGNPDTNAVLPVYAGQEPSDPTDNDLDGVNYLNDPFEFSADNGFALEAGKTLTVDFVLNPPTPEFAATLNDTGLLGAALDGVTPNQDAFSAEDGFANDDLRPGIFDNGGNLILGANAPKTQIKAVRDGTAIGTSAEGGNTLKDAVHTGVRIADDVKRLVAEVDIANWTADQFDGSGRVSGLMFGDGTQSNFIRFAFGDVGPEGGSIGLEVGIETDDDYQVIATVTDQAFIDALTDGDTVALGQKTVTLQLEISDIGGDYTLGAKYKVDEEGNPGTFQTIDLGGAVIPENTSLRAVLDGTHTISDGDTSLPSGAAIGIFAEKGSADEFTAVDFNEVRVSAFGNEIAADNAADVTSATPTDGTDTVIYDGTDTDLGALPDGIENFDGSASTADFAVEGNAASNTFTVGAGTNTITTGEGEDTVRGPLANLAGDTIADFSQFDEVIIEDFTTGDIDSVEYDEGSAVVIINGQSITLDGPDFVDFAAEDGEASFTFEDTPDGLRITAREPLSPVVAINAGGTGGETFTGTLRDTSLTFIGDGGGSSEGPGFTTTGSNKAYTNTTAQALDFPDTDLDAILASERSNANDFGYTVEVPNGTYLVDFIFAEIFHGVHDSGSGNTGTGNRVFDVEVEGEEVITNLDVQAEAGGAGLQLVKSVSVEVTDGVLNINLSQDAADADQAKLSGLVVWSVGGGFTPIDAVAPVIESVTVENPQNVNDGTREATVIVTDETGFGLSDFDGLDGSELTVTGIVPDAIAAPAVSLSADGKTATLTYELTGPANAWPSGSGTITVAEGTFQDAAGNTSAEASGGFVIESNLSGLARGQVVRAVNIGTTATDAGDLDGDDDNAYGGAIAADSLILDAFGNPVAFEADSNAFHTSAKGIGGLNNNVDGKLGTTGSNTDLDGSAYHTYRDSTANSWTSTFDGFENGAYIVELHFAELFHPVAGERVGDFTVNGVVFGDDYDAFVEGGDADSPSFVRLPVTVTDGTITVEVTSEEGQAGYSAVVVYEAVDPDLPPTISVSDVSVAEGSDAEIVFTRTGNLQEEITIEYTVAPGTADASEFGVASPDPVVIPAGLSSVTVTLPINDDDIEEGAETISVTINTVTNTSDDAVVADGNATVTILPSDAALQIPAGGTILELDFETAGSPLVEGGFDTVLGPQAGAYVAADAEVADGKLVVQTANGDLFQTGNAASKNDFVKSVDLSDPALNEIYITTQFDNPFTQDNLSNANDPLVADGVLDDFAQLGIIIAQDDPATNQNAQQFTKLIFGGNGGTAVQLWSQSPGGVGDTQTPKITNENGTLGPIASAAFSPFGLADIAKVELSLAIDKAAGTIAQITTFFDDEGTILGGTRPTATPGFFTQPPVPMVQAVADAIASGNTVVGVTSTDYNNAWESFEASWDFLKVSSPQFVETVDDATAAITGDTSVAEDGAASYTVTLSEDPAETTTVTVDVTAGAIDPASLPGDAELTDGGTQLTLTFEPSGSLSQTFTVDILDDTLPELDETFDVTISGIDITAGGAASVTTTIPANDGPVDSIDGTPVAGGDFSDDGLAPTDLGTLAEGETTIVASQQGDSAPGGRERDYFTFTVEEGQELTGIILEDWQTSETGSLQGFVAIQAGAQVTANPTTFDNVGQLLGGYIYGGGDVENGFNVDGNLLTPSALGAGSASDGFNTFEFGDGAGFSPPLPAGTYTLWLNQGGELSTATLRLVTAAVADTPVELSIADAADVAEADGAVLSFMLTATQDFTGQLEVAFEVDGTPSTQLVDFTDGTGTLTVPVTNDDVDNGDDTVTVALTGGTDQAASDPSTVTISAVAASAEGTVTEDDVVDPIFVKGDVVLAINAGTGAITNDPLAGIDFAVDSGFSTGSRVFVDGGESDKTGDNAALDGSIYETERFAPILTYTLNQSADGTPLVNGTQYVLELFFTELFQDNLDTRQFDVIVNGETIANDFVPGIDDQTTAEVEGLDVISTVATVVDGAIVVTLDADTDGKDNAKISGLALYEAVEVDPDAVSVSVADVTVDEDAGVATVTFTRTGASDEAVEITYSTSDDTAVDGTDYTAVSGATVTIPADGSGTVTVDIPLTGNDAVDGDKAFNVVIDSATAPTNTVSVSDDTAVVTLTDNDIPVGPGPDEDLDGDGIINALDDDVDGDGTDNNEETFSYDATNAGTALTPGQSVTFDFETDGTPFEAGFTGVLDSPKAAVQELDLDNATVADGQLTITATNGDHFGGNNSQQNAFVTAFSAEEGLRVETVFDAPDFDPDADGKQTPLNYQAAGVVIGLDQNTMMKAVFGREGPELQFAGDAYSGVPDIVTPLAGDGVAVDLDYALVAKVAIVLEAAVVDTNVEVTATASFLDADGNAIPGFEAVVMTNNGTNNGVVTFSGNIAAALIAGEPVGVGVIQTSTNDANGRSGFDVSYDSLTVTALGDPVDLPPTVTLENTITSLAEDANQAGAVKVADIAVVDDGLSDVTLTLAGDDADLFEIVGTELFVKADSVLDFETAPSLDVSVVATDGAEGSDTAALSLTVTDVNEAPTVALANVIDPAEFAEDADTISSTKVADIVVSDDALGTNGLALTGDDATLFAIVDGDNGPELHLAAGASLDFETNASLDVTVTVDDATLGATNEIEDSADLSVAVTDVNEAPTIAGEISDLSTTVGTATSADLSGLTLSDEDAGETLSLVALLADGSDLPAGITLDGTTLQVADTVDEGVYQIDVFANDGDLDSESAVSFTVTVGAPVNNPPTVALQNAVTTLPEDQDLTASFKVADIVVTDDGVGAQSVALSGTDAALFEIVGDAGALELHLKAGLMLDFETKPQLDVSVDVDDASIGDAGVVEDTATLSLAITNVDERTQSTDEPDDLPTDDTGGTDEEDTVEYTGDTEVGSEEAPYTLPDTIENFDATGTGTVNVQGNSGNNVIGVGEGSDDTVDLTLGGSDKVTGEASELDGTVIDGFDEDDEVVIEGTATVTVVELQPGSVEAGLDTNNDGEVDTTVIFKNLEFDETSEEDFTISSDGTNSTLVYAPQVAEPIRVQAEELDLVSNFYVQSNVGTAEGNQIIRLNATETGVATYDVSGFAAGQYLVRVGYFDENDGESVATISIGGQSESWVWDDDDTSGGAAQASSFRERTFGPMTIDQTNGTFTLEVEAKGQDGDDEFGRVDYIEFVALPDDPVDNGVPFAPGGIADQTATEQEAFSLDVSTSFVDPDEDDLTFSLTSKPVWLSIDGTTGILSGTPGSDDAGTYTVTVAASDGVDSGSATFTIDVADVNTPPEVGVIPNQSGSTGNDFTLQLSDFFSDADADDVLEYSVTGDLPDGLALDPLTGAITGTPTSAGVFQVTVAASDGDESAETTVQFAILGDDDRPEVTIEAEDFQELGSFFEETQGAASGDAVIRLGFNATGTATYTFSTDIVAAGLYDVEITYFDETDGSSSATISAAENGVDFTDLGTIAFDGGTDNAAQAANLRTVRFTGLTVDDGAKLAINGAADNGEFVRIDKIELLPVGTSVNLPPSPVGLDDQTFGTSDPISIDLTAGWSDPEEDPLTFTLEEGPSFLSIDGNNLIVDGTPAAGEYEVTVSASDGLSGIAVPTTFTLTIDDDNQAPQILVSFDETVSEGSSFELNAAIIDPEGGALIFDLGEDAPGWLLIDDFGTIIGNPGPDDVGTYTFDIIATDPGGLSTTDSATLVVENVNNEPEAGPDIMDQAVPANAPFTFVLPADAFSDADIGVPNVTETLTLSATLAGGAPLPDFITFDAATGTFSGTLGANVSLAIVVTATDAAGADATQAFTIQSGDVVDDREPITIEAEAFTDIGNDFVAKFTPNASGNFAIRPRDSDAVSTSTDLSDVDASGFYTVTIRYFDENDGESTASVSVDGVEIGAWVLNGNEGEQVFGGNAGGSVQPGNVREITFDTPFEVTPGTELSLTVDRQGNEQARIDLITLTPADAPLTAPTFNTTALTVDENIVDAGTVVTDDPGATFTLSATDGADTDLFTIDANGALVFKAAPDFEAPADDDGDGIYEVGVVATNTAGAATGTVSVTVEDVNEAPVGTSPVEPLPAAVGQAVTLPTLDTFFSDVDAGDTLTFSVDQLPDGVSVAADGVTLTGTPTVEGDTLVTVTATDSGTLTAQATFTIAVGAGDVTAPTASIALIDPVDADSALVVNVTLSDDAGIDETSLGDEDLSVTIGGAPLAGGVTFVDFADGVATYNVAPPAAGWDDEAVVEVSLAADEVTDLAGNPAAPVSQSTTLDFGVGSPVPVLRLNAFGPEVTVDDGPNWLSDADFFDSIQDRGDVPNGGNKTFSATNVPDGVPAEALQTARSSDGDIGYDISVDDLLGNGDYTVNLYFAEIFNGAKSSGARIFDIAIEGETPPELDNFDPNAGGGGQVSVISFDVTVDDGELNIDLLKDLVDGSNNAIINAIEILTNPDGSVDDEGPTAAITLTNPSEATGTLGVAIDLSDASGVDATSFGDGDIVVTVDGVAVPAATVSFDTFDGGTASYTVNAPDGGWTDAATVEVTLQAGAVLDTAATPNGNLEVSQSATLDIGGGTSGGDEVVYRINTGGDAVTSVHGGPDWTADEPGAGNPYLTLTGPRDEADTGPSPNPDFDGVPNSIFATARSSNDPFSYDIPVSELGGGENYEVRLYLAELFEGGQEGGFRNFDATLEGFTPPSFDNIDPGTLFGADAGVLTAKVNVDDGVLNIGFEQDIEQNPIINGIEIVAIDEEVTNPVDTDPGNALDAFAAQTDLDTSQSYGGNAVGAAVLEVMTGVNNIQSSNFGGSSFQVTNTGDKKISAIYIDVNAALYPDSVFDPDGQGGDDAAKSWQVDSGGNTGAFITGSGYFDAGVDPIPNNTGTGGSSNGGFKGAMVKFNPNNSDGFESGETVGFSGDMDPNSIAGLTKASVDGTAIDSWDVGGISGHELIGSTFTVLFDDGTTASGELASDGSSAGSHALATQDTSVTEAAPGLQVDGINPGNTGTYGGDVLPTVIVTGNPGDKVQITLTKGFNPVTNTANGIATLVEDRLDRYDFKANNAFDAQTEIVTIGPDGTFDASTLFDYDDAVNNNVQDGQFPGDDVQPIAFVATKVQPDGDNLPISPTTAPIYLTNVDGPVTGDPTGGTGGGVEGHYTINGSGNNAFFKVQIEDATTVNGGLNPNGKWNFLDGPDSAGRQLGFGGDGYYVFGSETSTGIDNNVGGDELLEFTILVEEGDTGNFDFRVRASRDPGFEPDQQNDIWWNFKPADEPGNGNVEDDFLVGQGDNKAHPTQSGFLKVFGGPQNGTWDYAGNVDGETPEGNNNGNFGAKINISEPGLYTLQIDGRSQGFHVDWWELNKSGGGTPGPNAPNSTFVPTGPAAPTVDDPIDDITVLQGTEFTIDAGDAFTDINGDDLTFTLSGDDTGGELTIDADTGVVTGTSQLALGEYSVTVTASDGDFSTPDTFELTVTDELVSQTISRAISSIADDWEERGSGESNDFEMGANGPLGQQYAALRFTDIDIPVGATVTEAYIQFTAQGTNNGDASFDISIESDETAAPYTEANLPGDRDYEGTFVWNPEGWTDGNTYESPDLADLINGVIGDDGLQDGALGFLIDGNFGSRVADAFDTPNGDEPILFITFEEPL